MFDFSEASFMGALHHTRMNFYIQPNNTKMVSQMGAILVYFSENKKFK
jgi:hypothetical protein